jgi:enoyl-CoA hydratase
MAYETLLYDKDGAIATITLNRPERLNTIVPPMPDEIEAAVTEANRDPTCVIVLRARAFARASTSRGLLLR